MKRNTVLEKTRSYLRNIFDEYPEEGFRIVRILLQGAKNNKKLEIFVDKDGGVTIADCVMITKRLSKYIDNDEDFDEHYILEVSSPGESDNKGKEA